MREHWCYSQTAYSAHTAKKDPANAESFSVFISNFYT